jgi:hypothetical protein
MNIYAYVVFADNSNNAVKVTFLEDMTETIWIKFSYTFTEPTAEEMTILQEKENEETAEEGEAVEGGFRT